MGGRSKDLGGRQAGGEGLIERLYRSPFREELKAIAMATYPLSLDAEDIVQETFVAEWDWQPEVQQVTRGGGERPTPTRRRWSWRRST